MRLRLESARVLAVVTLERVADASPLVRTLFSSGIQAVEITLRTAAAIEVIRHARQAVPEMLIGAGTVLSRAQADAARTAGAHFALAPGFDEEVARHCLETGLPFVPGVATASEIQAALKAGFRLIKVFPVESIGGPTGLRVLAAPFRHLGIKFIPLGGIGQESAPTYLADPAVTAVGGSWIAPADLVARQAWDEIGVRAREARTLW